MEIPPRPTTPTYELVDHKNQFHEEHWCIKIHDGNLEGLVFQYDTVKVEEETDGNGAMLSFNTVTVENPHNADLTVKDNQDILGHILTDLIIEGMEHDARERNIGESTE